jgi:manganese/zinc/iron transport system substrate-binding protein
VIAGGFAVVAVTLVLLLAPLVATPARGGTGQDAEPIRVTTTVGMIGDLARNIGGDRVEVVSLMGPGVDPHLYRPSAGDVGRLEEADIIFYGGLELEGRMTDTFVRVARTGKPTVAVAEGIPVELLRQPPEFEGRYDPHIWFDVTLWMEAARTVNAQLAALEPGSAGAFQANTDAYLVELEALNGYVQEQIARIPEGQRVLITAHDAFGYFGDRYGLEVLGLQGVSTAAEVSANDIQALADLIAERRIPAVFVESSVPPATVEALQGAVRSRGFEVANGGTLFSDAMGEAGTPEGTYLGMVRHNVDTIVAALAAGAPPATPAAG